MLLLLLLLGGERVMTSTEAHGLLLSSRTCSCGMVQGAFGTKLASGVLLASGVVLAAGVLLLALAAGGGSDGDSD